MQYKIDTAPLIEALEQNTECPLCVIQENVSARLVSQYLNEAVMVPDYRVDVNKYGFCANHLLDLYSGENKLGLALQVNTRTENVISQLSLCKNAKQAQKHAAQLAKCESTCIICMQQDATMERYYSTFAQLFLNEPSFAKALEDSRGFCVRHYVGLLNNCSFAGAKTESYLATLYLLQTANMKRVNGQLAAFIDSYDYRNKQGKTDTSQKEALPKAIDKLKSKIIKNIND